MHLLKALRTQQVPQKVGALLALRQPKVSWVLSGKCIIFKHAQKRCFIAELFLDFVFPHERKLIKPEIYGKFTKPLYICFLVPPKDIMSVYSTNIRPVLEYACQVWHFSIPQHLNDQIEQVQHGHCELHYHICHTAMDLKP